VERGEVSAVLGAPIHNLNLAIGTRTCKEL
jgi:hypothetical protein